MSKRSQRGSPGAEGGRRPTGAAGDAPKERGRWSSQRKLDIVLRILRGEGLDALSRELNVTPARLTQWRDDFLAAGQDALKSRQPDHRDEENTRLKAKVGELLMDTELLKSKIHRLEDGLPPTLRRPRK